MKPQYILVHHSAGPVTQTIAQINDEHHRKDWGNGARIAKSALGYYVAYHYVIEANGKLTQTCLDTEPRWQSGSDRNQDSIAVCLLGNFDINGNMPTAAQVKTLQTFLRAKTLQYGISPERVTPHRKWTQTACYGRNLPDDWASKLAQVRVYYQILDPKFLGQYKTTEIEKLRDGRIVLKEGVVPRPGTTKPLS